MSSGCPLAIYHYEYLLKIHRYINPNHSLLYSTYYSSSAVSYSKEGLFARMRQIATQVFLTEPYVLLWGALFEGKFFTSDFERFTNSVSTDKRTPSPHSSLSITTLRSPKGIAIVGK
jgi:hypothetical protein